MTEPNAQSVAHTEQGDNGRNERNGASSAGIGQHDIEALLNGRHWDPFAVLGPHTAPDGSGTLVRTVLSGARGVTLTDASGKTLAPMHPLPGADGLFVGTLSGKPTAADYRLQIDWGGAIQVSADTYAFGPVLQDGDLDRLAWGDPSAVNTCLGSRLATVDGIAGVL